MESRLFNRLATRVVNMVARAVVNAVDDTTKMQLLQLQVGDDETLDDIERLQNYGFTSNPKPGAEAAVIFVGGRRDHGLTVAVDDRRYRIVNLESGEVAVHDCNGSKIVLKADGNIEITSAGNVVLNGGVLNVARVTDTAGPYPIIGGNPTVKA